MPKTALRDYARELATLAPAPRTGRMPVAAPALQQTPPTTTAADFARTIATAPVAPLDSIRTKARTLRTLSGRYTRLVGPGGNGDRVADLVTADAEGLGAEILEAAELLGAELDEARRARNALALLRVEVDEVLADPDAADDDTAPSEYAARLDAILTKAGVQ